MPITTQQKITLENVYDNFDQYNFLIFTNMGTIDTSYYNTCKLRSDLVFGHAQTHKILYLYKRSPLDTQVIAGQNIGFNTRLDDQTEVINKYDDIYIEKYVCLVDNLTNALVGGKQTKENAIMVQNIIVKSKRNFLGNQEKVQKVEKQG